MEFLRPMFTQERVVACAAAVVGHHLGLLGTDVNVRVTGGALSVHWGGPGQSVWLTGPAQRSFEGHFEI